MDESIERLLEYWFGAELDSPAALDRQFARWFVADDAIDAEIASRFGTDAERAARGELAHFRETAKGRLALILLRDQVPRHLHRGTAAAFAQDSVALGLTVEGIENGMDLELPVLQRAFLYMPLQHAEAIDAQELALLKFGEMRDEPGTPEHVRPALDDFARHARMHRDIVARFGRFPHRNRALGREETAAEREFLQSGGPSFGQ